MNEYLRPVGTTRNSDDNAWTTIKDALRSAVKATIVRVAMNGLIAPATAEKLIADLGLRGA